MMWSQACPLSLKSNCHTIEDVVDSVAPADRLPITAAPSPMGLCKHEEVDRHAASGVGVGHPVQHCGTHPAPVPTGCVVYWRPLTVVGEDRQVAVAICVTIFETDRSTIDSKTLDCALTGHWVREETNEQVWGAHGAGIQRSLVSGVWVEESFNWILPVSVQLGCKSVRLQSVGVVSSQQHFAPAPLDIVDVSLCEIGERWRVEESESTSSKTKLAENFNMSSRSSWNSVSSSDCIPLSRLYIPAAPCMTCFRQNWKIDNIS